MKVILLLPILVLLGLGCIKKESNTIKVGIQPLDNNSSVLLDSLKSKIESFYGFEVSILKKKPIPKAYFVNIKSPRYRADSIIGWLKETKVDSLDYILGITSLDVSATKNNPDGSIKEPISRYTDWGIFGLGYVPGPACVVSSFRMGKKKLLKNERAQKVALHELGHNLGLPHCPNKKCFMQDGAESIKTVDKVNFNLCEKCKSQI